MIITQNLCISQMFRYIIICCLYARLEMSQFGFPVLKNLQKPVAIVITGFLLAESLGFELDFTIFLRVIVCVLSAS